MSDPICGHIYHALAVIIVPPDEMLSLAWYVSSYSCGKFWCHITETPKVHPIKSISVGVKFANNGIHRGGYNGFYFFEQMITLYSRGYQSTRYLLYIHSFIVSHLSALGAVIHWSTLTVAYILEKNVRELVTMAFWLVSHLKRKLGEFLNIVFKLTGLQQWYYGVLGIDGQ